MKRIRWFTLGLALVALASAPRAEAQVQLGWNSSMTSTCLNASCDWLQFTLNLSGLKPTDNNGNPVPIGIINLASPGYVSFLTIDLFSGAGLFTSASVVSGGSWLTNVTNGGITVLNAATATPYPSAPIVINAYMSLGGYKTLGYSGLAYLGTNGQCYDASGAVVTSCTSRDYRQGDFNGTTTAVPEPMTMTLLATGLVGLGLAGYRRRKQESQA